MPKIKDERTLSEIHKGRRKKLRDTFDKFGLETFNETQVLEFALGFVVPRMDTNPMAHRLINQFGSLNGVISAHPTKLEMIDGIGEQSSFFLHFLKQFVTYSVNKELDSITIRSPKEAETYLAKLLATYETEVFIILCLGMRGEILLQEKVVGGLDSIGIDIREILDTILRVKTVRILLAHNHLDGGVSPSSADLRVTRTLVNLLFPLGIDVMDHMIFGDNAKFSFSETGIIEKFRKEYKEFETKGAF
ncbi:MAG: hypothetical protein FWE16_03685 [Firmicutes bacterium]|nr:hypothetical protein [Bacillota bacterium]